MLPDLSKLKCAPCGEWFENFEGAQGSVPKRFESLGTIQDGAACAICNEALEDRARDESDMSREVEGLFETCGHVFHYECLGAWIVKGGPAGRNCPICREPIAPKVLQGWVDAEDPAREWTEEDDEMEEMLYRALDRLLEPGVARGGRR